MKLFIHVWLIMSLVLGLTNAVMANPRIESQQIQAIQRVMPQSIMVDGKEYQINEYSKLVDNNGQEIKISMSLNWVGKQIQMDSRIFGNDKIPTILYMTFVEKP